MRTFTASSKTFSAFIIALSLGCFLGGVTSTTKISSQGVETVQMSVGISDALAADCSTTVHCLIDDNCTSGCGHRCQDKTLQSNGQMMGYCR